MNFNDQHGNAAAINALMDKQNRKRTSVDTAGEYTPGTGWASDGKEGHAKAHHAAYMAKLGGKHV